MKSFIKFLGKFAFFLIFNFCILFTTISLFLFFVSKFIKKSFGSLPISQIIFNTFTRTEGMLGALKGLETYVAFCILGFIASVSFIIFLSLFISKKLKNILIIKYVAFFLLIGVFSTVSYFSLAYVERNFNVISYLKKENSNFIYDNYYRLDPSSINFDGNKKSNFILIFVESLEKGYSKEEVYGENLIPNLSSKLSEGISFTNFKKIQGAYFTIDGISAQTTGMPLIQLPDNFSMIPTDTYGAVLSNTLGIFNILKDQGYQTISFMGTHGWFTNMNLFLEAHGVDNLFDRNYFVNNGYVLDDKTLGFYDSFRDDFLFDRFKEYLSSNIDKSKNFAAVFQTYDTHFPNGFSPKDKKSHGDDNIKDAWLYVDSLVSGFLDWAKTQEWYDNTVIVVVGDHPWQDASNEFTTLTKRDGERQIFNLIIHSRNSDIHNSCTYSNIDMAPTILNALGINFKSVSNKGQESDSRIGLGVSLFSNDQTLVCKYGQEYLTKELDKYSYFYDTLQ